MKNFKVLWSIIGVLLIALSTIGYKFVQGSVAPSEDERTAVVLNKDERNLILKEMRNFLVITQGVSAAITDNDIRLAAKLATEAGMTAEQNTPGALLSKIPLSMKTLGFDTRKKFDQIATDAIQIKNPAHSRRQLDMLMQNCIACHASFKLVEAGK